MTKSILLALATLLLALAPAFKLSSSAKSGLLKVG